MNWVIFFVIFLASFFLTYIIRKFAIYKSILDIPNYRSSHTTPTPRGGGLAIVIAWYSGITYQYASNSIDKNLYFALLCGLCLVIPSFIDDLFNLSPRLRLLFQSISAIGVLFFLGGFKRIDFGFICFENIYLLTFIAYLGIIWFINLFNFMDGIDGLAATESIYIFLAFFLFFKDFSTAIFSAACLGFLIWNWQKAKIFMGDIGSTLIGFNVAVYSIYFQNQNKASIFIFLILSCVFWLDASITLLRRLKNREKLSIAHRKHAYQRIVQFGYSHQKVVLLSLLLNCFGLIFVFLAIKYKQYLLFLSIDLILVYTAIKFVDQKKPF